MKKKTAMEIPFNITRWTFALCALDAAIDGILIYNVKNYMPQSVRTILVCSRSIKRKCCASVRELPKRWYKHIFLILALRSTFSFLVGVNVYFFGAETPAIAWIVMDPLLGSFRKAIVPPEQTFLAKILFVSCLWKKLYETTCIKVYKDKKMSLMHYILGFLYYFTSACCVIGESPGYVRYFRADFHLENLTMIDYTAAVIFVAAALLQLQSYCILAELTKNEKDNGAAKSHKIPHGGVFNYVTGAPQFLEIVLYLMLSIILRKALTFHYVTAWILLDQVVVAGDLHFRYKKTFEDYPRERKIIVPLVF